MSDRALIENALRYIDRTIDSNRNTDDETPWDYAWDNDEVLVMLADIRGMLAPELNGSES